MHLTIELPNREDQMTFNRQRWATLSADPTIAALPFRIETNGHGQILMNPPPSGEHSYRQAQILFALQKHLGGRPLPECPISTIDGVRAADVGWYSVERFRQVEGQLAFEQAPEICVEVISSSNTPLEMKQKKQLYFEAGAKEVWFCTSQRVMEFFHQTEPDNHRPTSDLCPDFPRKLDDAV